MGGNGLVTAKSVVVKILFLITKFKFKTIFFCTILKEGWST